MRKYAGIIFLFLLTLVFYAEPLARGLYIITGDNFAYNYPMRALLYEAVGTGEFPLWNPRMFTGMPFMAAMQTGALYPVNYILYPIPMPYAFTASLMLHTFMASAFMYMFARLLTGREAPSAVAGAVFGYAGFVRSYIHVAPVLYTAAWLPLTLYFIEKLRRTGDRRHVFMGGLAITMQAFAGHPQTFAYSLLYAGLYAALCLAFADSRRDGLKFFGKFCLMALIGLAMAMPQLWASYELSLNALRAEISYKIFSQMSFHPLMLLDMIFRGAWTPPAGGSSNEGFIGILPLALGISAVIALWNRSAQAKALGIIALVCLALAMGAYIPPLHRAVYHIPGLNLFRAPMRHIIGTDTALIALFALGFSHIIDGDRRALRAFGAVVSAIAVAGLGAALLKWGASSAFLIPAAFCGLYALIIFLGQRAKAIPVAGLLLLVFIFESAQYKWLAPRWPENGSIETRLKSDMYGLFRQSGGRVAFTSLTGNTDHLLLISEGAELLGGYDPLIPGSVSDLLNMEGIGYSHSWSELISYNRLLSMLNVRYIAAPASEARNIESVMGRAAPDGGLASPFGPGFPEAGGYAHAYEKVLDTGKNIVYRNLAALPRAYGVQRLRPADNAEQVRALITTMRSEPSEEALLSPSDIERIGQTRFGKGSAEIISRSFNSVTLRADFADRGFLVISELFYPGWRAEVDGKETGIFRANGVMRGVAVPPGTHKVEFRYMPGWLLPSVAVSVMAGLISCIWSFKTNRRKALS